MNLRAAISGASQPRVLLIGAILAAAFALRVWGVGFDLPDISHPDEQHEVHRALRLAAGSFEWDRVGKGGYFYLLFVEYGVLFVALKLAGTVSSPDDFMNMFLRDPSVFWLIGRVTTAVLGTVNVWLTYRLGRQLAGTAVGVVAASFLAFCTLSVLHSHLLTVDIPMTTCVLATVYFAIRLFETGRMRHYLAAGFFAALAVMTKLSAAPVVMVIALAHLLRLWQQDGQIGRNFIDRRIVLAGIVCLGVYVTGNPTIIVMPAYALEVVKKSTIGDSTVGKTQPTPAQPDNMPARTNQWLYYGQATQGALGWPMCALVLVGIGYAALRHRPTDVLVLAFPLLLYLAIITSGSSLRHARFILPALPLLFVLVAQVLVAILDRLRLSQRATSIAATAVVVAVCAPRLYGIVEQNVEFTRLATPTQARQWIEEHVAEGTKILVMGYRGNREQRRTCPLRDTVKNMEWFADEIEAESPAGAKFVRLKAQAQEGITYDLTVIRPSRPWIKLEEAKARGIRYVVIPVKDFTEGARAVRYGRRDFYNQLQKDRDVHLSHIIHPTFTSPYDSMWRDAVIEIYEIQGNKLNQLGADGSALRRRLTDS